MKGKRSLVMISLMLISMWFVAPQAATATTTLAAPTLLSPANGSIVAPNPTLSWTAVPGAVRYHIQVDSRTYWDQQYNFIENWSLTGTSYTIAGHPEAYFPHLYWRVQAIDARGVGGAWSQVHEFTIRR